MMKFVFQMMDCVLKVMSFGRCRGCLSAYLASKITENSLRVLCPDIDAETDVGCDRIMSEVSFICFLYVSYMFLVCFLYVSCMFLICF